MSVTQANISGQDLCIEFRDVSFAYNGTPVFDNVSFHVKSGDLSLIVGPNGGGKTTLLKLVLGVLKPDKGKIKLFGDLPKKKRHLIGYTPQHMQFDPHFPISVFEVVLMGRMKKKWDVFYQKDDKKKTEDVLDFVGLGSFRDRQYSELSGGQRQRALIARSLVSDPQVLLLDEPTANIDHAAEQKLMDLLNELNRSMTILLVSHDLGFVSENIKSVICVNQNVLVHPTTEVTPEAIRQMYEQNVRMIRHDLDLHRGAGH